MAPARQRRPTLRSSGQISISPAFRPNSTRAVSITSIRTARTSPASGRWPTVAQPSKCSGTILIDKPFSVNQPPHLHQQRHGRRDSGGFHRHRLKRYAAAIRYLRHRGPGRLPTDAVVSMIRESDNATCLSSRTQARTKWCIFFPPTAGNYTIRVERFDAGSGGAFTIEVYTGNGAPSTTDLQHARLPRGQRRLRPGQLAHGQ